jgi:glycerol-3-phosphate O-acyltransferase/dihydroxyacetone phosphate acyltransferase
VLYRSLRSAARVALSWYYADIVVQGAQRAPDDGPLLVVSNHPNALVDALLVATTLRRRILLTAKATLFEHPVLAPLLRRVGVVPLRRATDERAAAKTGGVAVTRNAVAFQAVRDALHRGGAVLVFPEGISHDRPELAPLKTGAARMALDARVAGIRGLTILPIGLVFERKEAPRSRVLVRVGEPIDVDQWFAGAMVADASHLTVDIDDALRLVTLNFATDARADRAIALARALAAIADAPPSLTRPRPLDAEAEIAHRIERATDALAAAPPEVTARADRFTARLAALEARLAEHHVTLSEVRISPRLRHGAHFVVREGLLVLLALPATLIGRLTHWLPLHLARAMAMRPLAADPSRDQPAMRTIVLGLAFLLLWYVLQGVVVAHWFGVPVALLWLVVAFLAARIDFAFRARMRRAYARARTYLALRRDPRLRAGVLTEIDALLADAVALETQLAGMTGSAPGR